VLFWPPARSQRSLGHRVVQLPGEALPLLDERRGLARREEPGISAIAETHGSNDLRNSFSASLRPVASGVVA